MKDLLEEVNLAVSMLANVIASSPERPTPRLRIGHRTSTAPPAQVVDDHSIVYSEGHSPRREHIAFIIV
jgi:hypothetical protein